MSSFDLDSASRRRLGYKLIDRIDEMLGGGIVTLEKVRVLVHRATKK